MKQQMKEKRENEKCVNDALAVNHIIFVVYKNQIVVNVTVAS